VFVVRLISARPLVWHARRSYELTTKKYCKKPDQEPYCWEIKKCLPEERQTCSAYTAKVNCWEAEGTEISKGGRLACETCPVILSRIARAIARAMSDMPQRALSGRRE
jgi:hypothetical protein